MILKKNTTGWQQLIFFLFKKFFDIREGEIHRTVWMFFYLLLLIAALMIVKPVSTALFLTQFSAQQLPFAYILAAVFAAILASCYSAMLKKKALDKIMKATLGMAICLLLTFWVFIHFLWLKGLFLYLFFVWVSLVTLICASQFWLAAGLFFNVREAKRLFGPIGTGAIIGGVSGGYITNFLAASLGSHNLILIAIVCLFGCVLIMEKMWKTYGQTGMESRAGIGFLESAGSKFSFSQMITSRHLKLMAAVVAVSVIVSRLVDYQFNVIALSIITDKDELAAFLGFWMSNLNFLSLLIQIFITRKVLAFFGVGSSLFFLPFAVCIGAFATLIHPALWSAVMIKLSEGCFKNSLNKSSMELLFLPIPLKIKSQAKAFLDIFVDSAAGGIGGILLVFLIFVLNIAPGHISIILFFIVLVWFVLIFHVKKEYVRSFMDKLDLNSYTKEKPLGLVPDNIHVMERIIRSLTGPDEKETLRMLQMISEFHNEKLTDTFVGLLNHPNPDIQAKALQQLYFSKKIKMVAKVRELIHSESMPLRTEAVRYLFHHSTDPHLCLKGFLEDSDYRIRGAALLCLVREASKNRVIRESFVPGNLIKTALIQTQYLADQGEAAFTKKICAQAISTADIYSLYPYLYILMEDPDPDVVIAAIKGAGLTRHPEFIRSLLSFLGRRTVLKNAAADALINYGQSILNHLEACLSNTYMADNVRKHLPEVIAASGSQKAVDILSRHLMQPDPGLRYEVIRAMNRLRIKSTALLFDKTHIISKIKNEADDYLSMLLILYAQKHIHSDPEKQNKNSSVEKARQQLIRGLEIRLDTSLERLFRLLGLKYPPMEMYHAYKGIKSEDHDIRMSAMEFLDNVLDINLKQILMPLIETGGIVSSGDPSPPLKNVPDEFESYVSLLQSQDDFLKGKTLNLLAYMADDRYIPHMAALLNNSSRGVREMARFALGKTGPFVFSSRKRKH